jgi:hypothetical protein
VDSVEPAGGGAPTLTVRAADRAVAESRLLPLLRAAGAEVTEYRPARRSLEDIYLEIVGDDDDG